MILIEF